MPQNCTKKAPAKQHLFLYTAFIKQRRSFTAVSQSKVVLKKVGQSAEGYKTDWTKFIFWKKKEKCRKHTFEPTCSCRNAPETTITKNSLLDDISPRPIKRRTRLTWYISFYLCVSATLGIWYSFRIDQKGVLLNPPPPSFVSFLLR